MHSNYMHSDPLESDKESESISQEVNKEKISMKSKKQSAELKELGSNLLP